MGIRKRAFLFCLVAGIAPLATVAAQDVGPPSGAAPATGTKTDSALDEGFETPPTSARPRVWWHWMNGNVTVDGIDKDIDWLAGIGIGGVQNFDANLTTPQIVDKRLVYMTPAWKAAFRHAVERADAKGLEFAIASSPGWSETGGPWVAPTDGMKKVTWSETIVPGGKPLRAPVAAAPTETGPYQTLGVERLFEAPVEAARPAPVASGDIAVLAMPATGAGVLRPRFVRTTDGTAVAAGPLTDVDPGTDVAIATGTAEKPALLAQLFARPVTVRSARLFIKNALPPFAPPRYTAVLQAEVGGNWRTVVDVPLGETATTVSFAPVTASAFRIAVTPGLPLAGGGLGSAPGAVVMDLFPAASVDRLSIGQFQLFGEARITQAELKAGFGTTSDYYAIDSKVAAAGIAPEKIVDLTSRLRADGTVDWVPPAGTDWRIIRFGWSLTGKTNHPATPEATGLEVDKYDPAAVGRYLDGYLAMYRDAVGAENIGPKGIRALLTDSIEVGASNWTSHLRDEFRTRRGYDPLPWMPALAGVLIGSVEQSDRFLYDYRRTLAELMADAHYRTVAGIAHANGLKVYGEALEDGRPVLGDDLDMRRHADVPMAALWTFPRDGAPRPGLLGDMKGASSVAHFFGQNLVAAESMTSAFSPWAFAPSDLKRIVDLEFVQGVNRPVVHTSVHQPTDDKLPGLSLAIFGQYFNRHETWAGMARPWVDYLSRTSFMLQQGRNVADIAIFYGEEAPVTTLYANGIPDWLPKQHQFDFVNAGMLAALNVDRNHDLTSPGGARYRALYLAGSSDRTTVAALRELKRLADAGARVIGSKPSRSPALTDRVTDFDALVAGIWSGSGVVADRDADRAMDRLGLSRDIAVVDGPKDADLRVIHRTAQGGEIYFVNNRQNRAIEATLRFRVGGMAPEIWRAIDGSMRPLGYENLDGFTRVPLKLGPEDAIFVVFRHPSSAPTRVVPQAVMHEAGAITAPWKVSFERDRGAPDWIDMPVLRPLDAFDDPAVRYFSGTASYVTSLRRPRGAKADARLWIDLGKVGDVAEVLVNGRSAGIVWFAPFRVEVGSLLKAGSNRLEVRVANLWVNRLVGDAQPGVRPSTWTAVPTYRPDAPLRPSGLLGPVRLIEEQPGLEPTPIKGNSG